MQTTTASLLDFEVGGNYPSPVRRAIGLGYSDGMTNGVVETAAGRSYSFDMIQDSRYPARITRTFELRPLPAGAIDAIAESIAPYHPPEWPSWTPIWTFPSADAEREVNAELESQLSRAGEPLWVVVAADISAKIVSCTRAKTETVDWQREYANLLLSLHELRATGKARTPEAKAIRDRMDEPWYRLTTADQERMQGLAEDLKMLGQDGPSQLPMSAAEVQIFRERMREAWSRHKAGDHDAAIVALRGPHPVGLVPRSAILFLQYRAWADAGLPEIGVPLLHAAEKEDPSLQVFTLMLLRDLGRVSAAATRAAAMLGDPVQLSDVHACYQACATLQGIARNNGIQAAPLGIERIVEVLRRCWQQLQSNPSLEQMNCGLTVAVGCALGSGLQDLGDDRGAMKVYDRIITISPNDPDAWGIRGYLHWSTDRNRARSDFREAIRRGTRSSVPYVFLSKELLDTSPAEALKLVNAAEAVLGRFLGPLGAVLHQVRAFAYSELKQSQSWILEEMDRALALDPENPQIQSNRDAMLRNQQPTLNETISIELARAEFFRDSFFVQNKFAQRHETELADLFKQSA